jgi:TFIIF-interacting CTD phosphatase-like protein
MHIGPQRPLLILDLDETLVHGRDGPDPALPPADFSVLGYYIWQRPGLAAFLAAAGAWFDLAVWTASTLPYAQAVLERIMPADLPLAFVWSRTDCTWRLDRERGEFYWLKNLNKVKRRTGRRLERIVIIDDSPRKLNRHYGNLLRVRAFTGRADDTELIDLLPYLGWLGAAENMRVIDKREWRSWGGPGQHGD